MVPLMWIYFKQKWRASFLVFIVLIKFSVATNAAENDFDETEEDFFSEIPNVISATRIRQPLTEAPSSVTVIDRAMIEASGVIEIADVLRLVPGMQVSYPSGNQFAVTSHGFANQFPKKMQVLVDGRSVYQPSYADIDWLFIGVTLEDIDRIEVVRGPNSPLYGANAVQGVINIITNQPYQQKGTHIGFTGGSLATRNSIIRHSGTAGNMDYRVTATYEDADGLPGDIDSTNDGRGIAGLSFRSVLQHSIKDEIDIQLGIKDGRLGAGAELSKNPPAHNKQVMSNHLFIKWRHSFSNGGDSHLHFYRNEYDSRDSYNQLLSEGVGQSPATIEFLLGGLPDQFVELASYDYKGDRHDIEWRYNSPRRGKWRSMIGVGARLNRLKSLVLTNKDEFITDTSARIFANAEYRMTDSVVTSLGLMIEDSDPFGAYISPRIAVNYLFTPEHSLRISYSQTTRNPSLLEANFNQILKLNSGDDFLIARRSLGVDAETVTSIEIGFIGYWLNRNLFLDVKIFKEKTEDVIHELIDDFVSHPFPNITRPVLGGGNDGIFEVEGVEMQLKYQLNPKDFISLQYAYLNAHSTLTRRVGSPTLWISPERSVPENTLSLLISHDFSHGYEASIAYYYVSEMEWLGDGDFREDFHRVDLRIAKNWRIGKKRLKTEFIVHNIGDDYFTFRDENLFETRYFLRLGIDL